ncbi:EF-hand domain-containing protein [Psidium guajava]|nr:EF-hand domain-containing protein [Psidium guajava]
MGQIFDKFQGKEWRRKQIRKITDKVFDRVTNDAERANLTFEDLYIAVLLVYNDMNKHLPGPHFDPPSKDTVRIMIQESDVNLDGRINREEFVSFIERLTSDTFIVVGQGLIITLVVAPTIAMATKRTTGGVPGIGKLVQKLPNSVYASLVTVAVVLFQKSIQEV